MRCDLFLNHQWKGMEGAKFIFRMVRTTFLSAVGGWLVILEIQFFFFDSLPWENPINSFTESEHGMVSVFGKGIHCRLQVESKQTNNILVPGKGRRISRRIWNQRRRKFQASTWKNQSWSQPNQSNSSEWKESFDFWMRWVEKRSEKFAKKIRDFEWRFLGCSSHRRRQSTTATSKGLE